MALQLHWATAALMLSLLALSLTNTDSTLLEEYLLRVLVTMEHTLLWSRNTLLL